MNLENMEKDFGRSLRNARVGMKKSKEEMAERLGVDPSIVGRWESGTSLPPLARAKKITQACGLNEEEFIQKLQGILVEREKIKSARRSMRKR
ncbi:MAG: hypothetical protein A3E02_01290 [Candidatus Zambryskibacteria bacterium RIFCSPHIGHO2_12_FULL_38_34]|uniref:HTH cro/C1-type domain-containing protein n=1 Tax=Candidatus Zambryskibacteria bacterium RIFCSPLOWO2_12_FULL_39_16 TaxID=1802775 RepID=A0A1G2UTW4_9BACT|nr:MAG: hypothetical protein A3D37_01645 [Candidatus Zambryskibacteria bacterium RIFCSPHIGHO2_02_FULL_38_22]OHA97561.1 MAG: hypothetical protein A3E02_01290 [Candidatus Zambryskibacteria bacterium RIFCSPHIGHO2_12_FULL_38_34]OHB08146.1 MAG: hypothetical protein A3I19_02490 [Candidatus Zambryskibacteria bacterium RIFCSPLOWO2_02_FULL_38_13]OHB12840.1 MAG: hypothetical protein A3G46_02385 [Candidatus Zambryskibacteria bacterium RIFCSPLOWO2_12_FULL_39_16]